jgi:hypothetical protein
MATFVLVHGAMHGAWCWRDVRGPLRDAHHCRASTSPTAAVDRGFELIAVLERIAG